MTKITAEPVTYGRRKMLLVRGIPYNDRFAIKVIPGAFYNKKRRGWLAPFSPFTAYQLNLAFPEIRLPKDLLTKAECHLSVNDKKYTDSVRYGNRDFWVHQDRCLGWVKLCGLRSVLLAFAMGAGKTRVAAELFKTADPRKVLVVAPKAALPVWGIELRDNLTGFDDWDIYTLKKGTKKSKQKILEMVKDSPFPALCVINYEMVWRDGIKERILNIDWGAIVADECHKIRTPGTNVTLFFAELHDRYPDALRLGLSGTPLGGNCLHAYGIYRFLDAGIFGTSYKKFRDKYAVMGDYGPQYFINQEDFKERFHWICYRVSKKEALPWLPKIIDVDVPVEMPHKAWKHYKELSSEFATKVVSGEIVANNALTHLLRLQELTSGFLRWQEKDQKYFEQIHTAKADALQELMEGIEDDQPIIIFARFRPDLDIIQKVSEKVGRRYMELSGRRDEWESWQRDCKGGEVIGVQISSGGAGIDLTRAHYCIYYSVGFSLDDYLQSMDRVHRPGQENQVTYYRLIVEGTVDEKVYRSLKQKEDVVKSLVDLVKQEEEL